MSEGYDYAQCDWCEKVISHNEYYENDGLCKACALDEAGRNKDWQNEMKAAQN